MRIDVRGCETGYDDTGGSGIPLVLVHGFPLDRRIWAAQTRGLAGVARVIAPDLRGFGESSMAGGSMTMTDYARDVCALLDALDVERAVICGVSMGGYVALTLHRLLPQRVLGLVLVDTRAGADSTEAMHARDVATELARKDSTAAIAWQLLPKMLTPGADESLRLSLLALMSDQTVEGVVGALEAIRDRADSRPALHKIQVPVLVVHGAEDTRIPPSEAEAMRDGINGASLVLVPGAAHLPNFEKPEAFNAAVGEWLATVPWPTRQSDSQCPPGLANWDARASEQVASTGG